MMKKLNHILQEWPSGAVITSNWLKGKRVYKQLVNSYINSGWIERTGTGVFKRTGDDISWKGGLYALQKLQKLSIHVGGRTALELQGYGHYVKMRDQNVILWKIPGVRLPTWFQKYDWNANLGIRSVTLFSDDLSALTTKTSNQIEITISSAERAILEYLYDIPRHEGFDEANYIMEGLTTLRPSFLQQLLESCKSIRVKRLFMYLAENYNHAWHKKLDSTKIDFGAGKREIIKGGKLNKKYKIVVPELSREDYDGRILKDE